MLAVGQMPMSLLGPLGAHRLYVQPGERSRFGVSALEVGTSSISAFQLAQCEVEATKLGVETSNLLLDEDFKGGTLGAT